MDVVFFDASVLFKAAVTRFLLGAAVEGEFRAVWSSAVVEEARRNLSEAGRTFALAALEQNLEYVRDALVSPGSQRVGRSLGSTDEKDRHVLAAAISARATVLVTNNAKHFDLAAAGHRGVAIATPDEFATSLAERNPHALVRRVERTPPERLERYVALLRAELPAAMAIVEPLLGE